MKKISTLLLICSIFSFSTAFAQSIRKVDRSSIAKRAFTLPSNTGLQFRMELDTLLPPAFSEECGDEVAFFGITDNWGFVSGMNGYTDLQKAQRFTYEEAASYTVNEVLVFFHRADVINDGELKINIYEVGTGGGPGMLLGSSDPINVSDIVVPGENDPLIPTPFTFSAPPLVSGSQFFVSVYFSELYTTQDTVGIFNSVDECGDGGSVWELFEDGATWSDYISSWDTNVELLVSAIVEKQEDIVLQPVDTAFTPSFLDTCSQTVTAFGVTDGWGWVSGTNSFQDLEKAQRFDFAGGENYEVTQVGVFFNQASAVGDGEVTVKIYAAAPDGSPGALLGTSDPLNVSELVVDPQQIIPTFFTFSEATDLTSSRFFASVDLSGLYNTQDTVGIFNTRPGCGSGNSTYELFSDGTSWVPYSSENSWQIDVDLLIFAILEQMSTDVDDLSPKEAGLHLTAAYPNPASDQITLDYELEQQEDIRISIHHANGQLIRQEYLGSRATGTHREQLDLNELGNGVYFFMLSTTRTRVMKKLIIQK